MAIDLRLRPPAKGFLSMHVYTRSGTDYAPGRPGRHPGTIGREEARSVKERSLEILFEEMDEVGITHGVLPGREAIPPYNGYPNDDIYDLVRKYSDRFIGLPHANPHDRKSAFGEIDRASDTEGIPGIHLEPGWIADPRHANDPILYPLYERCTEKGLVAAISGGGWIGPDFNYVNPVDIQQVANAFPELTLVVCHAGWPWIDVMIGVAYTCPNVYVSPDMYMTTEGMPGAERYVEAANFFLEDRLLFGTAYPVRSLRQSIEQLHRLPFKNDEVKEKVLTHNAKKLFGL